MQAGIEWGIQDIVLMLTFRALAIILRRGKAGVALLNFTVGPVQSGKEVREIGYEQVPYFRTPEFSDLMLENERLIKRFVKAEDDARAVFITGSGTASMEAAVMNMYDEKDRVLIVNGGTFGQRFVELCRLHGIPYTEISVECGKNLRPEMLQIYENAGYTGFLVNVHETSTGVLYDMEVIHDFCERNHLFLVVDAISSFLADPFDMKQLGVDVMITGSQKALACPPGISIIVMSENAVRRAAKHRCKCMYFDLYEALKNGERGQTPFTPAVGILRQIHVRLKGIDGAGGVEAEIARIADLAQDFRRRIVDMPFEIISESLSNAVTPLRPLGISASRIVTILKDEYNIWVCPNGGDLADQVFRVGHIGDLTKNDNIVLVEAFGDIQKRGLA